MSERLSRETVVFQAENLAKTRYADLAYHNYEGHVETARREAARLIQELASKNISIDALVVDLALLYHDACFHLDHKAYGYETKEELSADIAKQDLTRLGLDETVIAHVCSCIMATMFNAEPDSNEATLVRLVDVGNVYGGLWEFAHNGLLLAKEAGQRQISLPDTYQAYCANSSAFLEHYFGKPPVFFDDDGAPVILDAYYLNARRNLETLKRVGKLPLRLLSRVIPSASQLAPQNWFDN